MPPSQLKKKNLPNVEKEGGGQGVLNNVKKSERPVDALAVKK